MCSANNDVRFEPIADIRLFDHLIGTGEQRGRHFEAKRLRGFEIDHQLEFGWLLDRQVGRLGALENFSGVLASLAICSANVGSVAHQTTGGDELTREVNRRDCVARRQCYELKAPTEENRIGHNKKQTDPLLDEASECAVNVLVGAGVQDMEL